MTKYSQYRVLVSRRFIVLSLVSCVLLAFAVGRTARVLLLKSLHGSLLPDKRSTNLHESNSSGQHIALLPNPVLQEGKTIPQTKYSSRNFNTAKSSTIISRFLTPDEETNGERCENESSSNKFAVVDEQVLLDEENDFDEEEEVHLPAGQHLLLDIKNVDSGFLSSEERLAGAMLDIVYECGLTLLSYHCHGLEPSGVSCVGVLLESHVSFHTWPEKGVITLDLFTCGPNSLLPIFANFRRLFSVPSTQLDQSIPSNWPQSVWSYKLRGFSSEKPDTKSERTDFFTFPIGAMTEYKEEIASLFTVAGYRFDIYDTLRPHFQASELYLESLVHDGSYESRHPDTVRPDRLVFVNGILQSRRSGDASYHESLVHPAMFSHKHPRRVAVVGGGDGAIVREVLKHKTVENVFMIEQQQDVIDLTRKHFPEYSDCSAFLKGIRSCFDDPRVTLVAEDPSGWLDKQKASKESNGMNNFDVVLVDETDYVDDVENSRLIELLFDALSPEGVLVAEMGEAPSLSDPHVDSRQKSLFIQRLLDVGFVSVKDYEEANSGFERPWEAVIAFKKLQTQAEMFQNEALTSIEIRNRSFPEANGSPSIKYYDGTMHQTYLYPSKASEAVFCRGTPLPEACSSLRSDDPVVKNMNALRVGGKSNAVLQSLSDHRLWKMRRAKAIAEYIARYGENPSFENRDGVSNLIFGYNPVLERRPHLRESGKSQG